MEPPAAPSVMAHPGLRVHPPLLLIPPPASSQCSEQLDAFSKFSGHCCFLLKFLTPLTPSPPWEKPVMPGHLLCLGPGGRGGEEQLAGPGSCEVQGCQGEEPRLQGRHGKAVSKCYPDPSCRQPRSAPSQDFWPPSGPGGRQMGLQQGPVCPAGHRLCQECPSAWAESPGSERGYQP